MNHFLIKSEPSTYSIDDLKKDKKTPWTGIRNYVARNVMRDEMKPGDLVLFYHSSCEPPHVAGIAKVASEAYPDPTQFDSKSDYYDPKSTKEKPIWMLVDMAFVKKAKKILTLEEIKADPKLKEMILVQKKGQRLSVQPVTKKEFEYIEGLIS